jgi:hypothetical protein
MFYFCEDSWNNLPLEVQLQVRELLQHYNGELRFRHDGHLLRKSSGSNYLAGPHRPYNITSPEMARKIYDAFNRIQHEIKTA